MRALLQKLSTLFKTKITYKKIHRVLEFEQSKCLKIYVKFHTQKRTEAEITDDKDGKAFCKLISNVVRLVSIEKVYLKWPSKPG